MTNHRVGVLCGGPSREREISLRSGKAVHQALLLKGFDVALVELSDDPSSIPDQIRNFSLDAAFIALHGFFGEDGQIQKLLDDLRIPYTGSSAEASRSSMDKIVSRQKWAAAGLPVPQWTRADAMNGLHFPLMVKPSSQGSSIGMSIVDRPEDLSAAIQEAQRQGGTVLVEEYLSGRELTVGILEGRPLPVIQVVPKRRFYDYVAKYTPGMTEYIVPAPLSPETTAHVQDLAQRAHTLLGCGSFSRVDMIYGQDRGPVILEINTIPGMTETSLLPKAAAVAGIDFPSLCVRMLSSAVNRDIIEK